MQVFIELTMKIHGKKEYETTTIMEREVKGSVPPGVDPADYLVQLCQEEMNRMKKAFNQFPQYLALNAPKE